LLTGCCVAEVLEKAPGIESYQLWMYIGLDVVVGDVWMMEIIKRRAGISCTGA
jgi:hypothetical protein